MATGHPWRRPCREPISIRATATSGGPAVGTRIPIVGWAMGRSRIKSKKGEVRVRRAGAQTDARHDAFGRRWPFRAAVSENRTGLRAEETRTRWRALARIALHPADRLGRIDRCLV